MLTDAAPTARAPRRRPAPPRFLPMLCAAAFLAAAFAPPAYARDEQDVLAHGTDQWFWVVRVSPVPESGKSAPGAAIAPVQTRVFARPSGGGWRQWWQPLGRRVQSVASRDGQLAVLLDDGPWLLLSESDAVSGRPLAPPGAGPLQTARLLALGGHRDTLWAVARVPGGIAALAPPPPPSTTAAAPPGAATRSATRPATSLAAPATTAVARRLPVPEAPPVLSLVRLEPGGWAGVADLPPHVARPGEHDVSLAIVEDAPHVAVRAAEGGASRDLVELYRLAGDARWARVGSVSVPRDARHHKLLSGAPVPTLAVTPGAQREPDVLYFFDGARAPSTAAATRPARAEADGPPPTATRPATRPTSGPAPVSLQATAGSPPADRAVATAAGMIRAVYSVDPEPGKDVRPLFEQRYDLRGTPDGSPSPVMSQAAPASPITMWRWAVVTVAMVFAVAASFRRREQMRRVSLENVRRTLAPLGTRVLGGLFDALPVVASVVTYLMRMDARDLEAATAGWYAHPITWTGLALYLLHTTASEVLTGRTMGKALVGLRVVSLDGSVPDRSQMLTRNLLRIIDAGLLFVPVLLVPFSPLRQRVGDAAAGTLVVAGGAEGEEDAPAGEREGEPPRRRDERNDRDGA